MVLLCSGLVLLGGPTSIMILMCGALPPILKGIIASKVCDISEWSYLCHGDVNQIGDKAPVVQKTRFSEVTGPHYLVTGPPNQLAA